MLPKDGAASNHLAGYWLTAEGDYSDLIAEQSLFNDDHFSQDKGYAVPLHQGSGT